MHAYVSAFQSRHALNSTIEILERERDQLIPLAVEGPPHLRSLRLRQMIFIEHRLVYAQAEQAKLHPELYH